MKITIYTINDCKFSQAEKDYLKSKNVQFEEKNLETNREYLTEMLEVSNNFAGTPVTKIEKDDGSALVLKGFTQAEFDTALGLNTEATTPPTGLTTAATAQAASDMNQSPAENATPDVSTVQAATDQPAVPSPSMDMTQPQTESPAASMPDMSTPETPMSTPDMNNMPADLSEPVAPSMDQSVPQDMTTPAPTLDMSQPQGEAIPNPASTESQTTPTPPTVEQTGMSNTTDSSNMGAMPTPDMSGDMNQSPQAVPSGDNNPPNQANSGTNDPLNSVLNDLQSKGNN